MMKEFTLASFNIGAASKMYNRYDERDLSAIADFIKDCKADIVACQEVDLGCERSHKVDMPAYLSDKAGYPYYHFIEIRPFQGGLYGTLILSKFKITDSKTIHYKVKVAKQGTSCGYVTVNIGNKPVTVFNTHLSCESDEGNADTMACLNDELSAFIADHGDVLCCGDFNTSPAVVAAGIPFVSLGNKDLYTYADRSIDNVLYTDGFEITDVRTADATTDMISDHNMLICKVIIK